MTIATAKYIGIDPGQKGGIAWLDKEGNLLGVMRMPVTKDGDTCFMSIAKVLKQFPSDAHVITEALTASHMAGKKAVWSLARSTAILDCAIQLNKLACTKVMPKKWQQVMWTGQKMLTKEVKLDNEGTKKMKTDTKKISENTFRKLFPRHVTNEKLIVKSSKGIRLHDGIVDAVLLAVYGKRSGL